MIEKRWVKLQRYNDWGAEYLAYPEEGLRQGSASWKRGLDFEKTPTLRVRWPNGDVTEARIVENWRAVSVGDMGHTYETSSATVCAVVDVNGRETHVPLTDLEVEYGSIPYRDGRTPKAPPPREWMSFEEGSSRGIIQVQSPGSIGHGGEWDVEIDWENRQVGVRRWA